jgi:hypothetical protein
MREHSLQEGCVDADVQVGSCREEFSARPLPVVGRRLGSCWTWPRAFDSVPHGGNILDPIALFRDASDPGGTAAFLAIDMAIAWLVFMV